MYIVMIWRMAKPEGSTKAPDRCTGKPQTSKYYILVAMSFFSTLAAAMRPRPWVRCGLQQWNSMCLAAHLMCCRRDLYIFR